ncbi:MAG: HyaD/HybD family hydrogenase maturation endopeptidase [Planctomycetota bacterium]
MQNPPRILVLGIGNLLWADEGFGVRAVEEFHRRFEVPEHVQLLDGGTQGIYLVQHVRDADVLVVFDAVDFGLAPGAIRCYHDDEVPQFLGAKKISLHQTGFQEVLAMADMMGDAPERLFLIGVQPVELDDYGGGLRPEVHAQIEPAIELARGYLRELGVETHLRSEPLPRCQTIACPVLNPEDYEQGRPSNDAALRSGDPRVLAGGNFHAPGDYNAEIEDILARTPEEQR